MATYLVMEKQGAGEADAEAIRDGFSLVAFLLPLIWLLWHRLWLEAGAYLVLAVALFGLGWLLGLGDGAGWLVLPLNALVGLEASTLRQSAFRRRGWTGWGAVEASNTTEAMIRYLAEAGHSDAEAEAASPLPMRYTADSGPALGLFSYPGRR